MAAAECDGSGRKEVDAARGEAAAGPGERQATAQVAARSLGQQMHVLSTSNEDEVIGGQSP